MKVEWKGGTEMQKLPKSQAGEKRRNSQRAAAAGFSCGDLREEIEEPHYIITKSASNLQIGARGQPEMIPISSLVL
ncbi:hypothetical protein GUJ93_ZPchr0003g17622 [Zizania palustris]|uniref:Uncharacterized protein n=1 Tax=Zizania palustris TaxID=103762 RepID=A0A8J5S6V2_ZIZPA|nr:hypothetical protein GUJ93_ZPchr0003g17622 [Zizania palustris]